MCRHGEPRAAWRRPGGSHRFRADGAGWRTARGHGVRSHTRERMPPEDTARKDSSQGGKGQCRGCEACSAGLKHCRARAQTRDGMPSPWSEPLSQSPRRPAGLRPTRCLHATYGFLVEGCSPCTRTSVNRLAVPGLHVSDQSRRVGQGRRVRLCSPPETHCLLLQVTHLQEKCPRPWHGLVCNVKHSHAAVGLHRIG